LRRGFEDLIFISKETDEYERWRNFRAIQFRVGICLIWSPYMGDMTSAKQENLGEAYLMEIKFA
jgi:hypothetical protein